MIEVKFKELTPDGSLRQPTFMRLRDDKQRRNASGRVRRIGRRAEPLAERRRDGHADVGGRRLAHVDFTNLDKVFWPADGYTKGDLIEYYRAVSKWLLPYLRDRPLVMTRYPGRHRRQVVLPEGRARLRAELAQAR